METLLASPDDLTYQSHGMLFGAALLSQASRWRAVTPIVAQTLVSYMENCMIDGTNIGIVDQEALWHTGDLAAFIATSAPSSLAYFDDIEGEVRLCSQGWAAVEAQLGQEVQRVLRVQAASQARISPAAPAAIDVNALTGPLEDYQNFMGLAGYDATRYLQQAMLIQALDDASVRLIANSGNSAAMSLYQSARAEQQTRSSYQAVGMNSLKWVPILKIVFEMLYFGAFPLAMLLMMTPLALSVVKGYFSGFVWLAAWEPLSAILHTAMNRASTGYYREHTTTLFGSTTRDVLSWANHFGVQAVEQEIGATAGYLMMSVPFLSFAIFFGASKLSGMATSMLNVSQGAAIDTGREASGGNVSLGNTSMNTMSANKWNTLGVFDTGRYSRTLADGSVATTNADGSRTFAAGTAQSNVGLNATLGGAIRSEVSGRRTEAERAVEATSQDYSESLAAAANQLSDFARTASQTRSAGTGVSTQQSTQAQNQLNEAWSTIEQFSRNHSLSTDLGLQAMIAGGMGLPPGVARASLEASGRLNASDAQSFQEAVQASSTGEYRSVVSSLQDAGSRLFSDENNAEGMSASESVRHSLDTVRSNATRLSAAYETSDALERTSALVESSDAMTQLRISDAFAEALTRDGYSDAQIASLLSPNTGAGIRRQRKMVDHYLPEILSGLGLDLTYDQRSPGFSQQPTTLPVPEFQPVDPQVADAQIGRPEVGRYGQLDQLARGRYNQATSDRGETLLEASRERQGAVAAHRAEVQDRAGQLLPTAFGERLLGIPSGVIDAMTDVGQPSRTTGMGMASSMALGASLEAPTGPPTHGEPLRLEVSPTMAAPRAPMMGAGGGYVDRNGFYQATNISYAFDSDTVRDQPVRPETMARLSSIVGHLGPDYGMVVTSGGQPASGPDRTGSHRHDHGEAVDFYLTRGTERINPADDPQLYADLIARSAQHFDGIGHYSWGVHVGGGAPGFWGPDRTAGSADPYFREAYDRGRR